MPTNPYISQSYSPSQTLYEDLIIEAYRTWGRDLLYIPRDLLHEDKIMGEDIASEFKEAYWVEMYLKNVDSYDGQGDLFQRFGVEVRDEATYVVSKRRFEQTLHSTPHFETIKRPREGDLIFEPLSNSLFEITFVEHEKPFYMLNQVPIYELVCSLFQLGGQDIDTQVIGLDIPAENQSHSLEGEKYVNVLTLSARRAFVLGETLTQTQGSGSSSYTVTGEIVKILDNGLKFWVSSVKSTEDNEYRIFNTGSVTGSTSGLTGTISSVSWKKDDYARNDELATEADTKINNITNSFGYDL